MLVFVDKNGGNWELYKSWHSLCPPWTFVHEDYDGAEDGRDFRCGHGESVMDCIKQIKNLVDEEG